MPMEAKPASTTLYHIIHIRADWLILLALQSLHRAAARLSIIIE